MTILKFILRSLIFFRRQHLALFAGTLVATAVLTGALIIGDSVKYSLQNLAETRLGSIRYSLSTGGRFVRSELATELSSALEAPASAILMLQGIAINQESQQRINRVQVLGVDSSFWNFSPEKIFSPGIDEAVISENTATELGLKIGDALLLRVEKASLIPLNAPFSPENRPSVAFRLTIKEIANDKNLGRFSLKSNQVAPFTVFINRENLSWKLELTSLCNIILIGENSNQELTSLRISDTFASIWRPIDAGIELKDLPDTGKFELVSNRVFIDVPVSNEIEKLNIPHHNILSYLVNTFRSKADSTPYSFVSALPESIVPMKRGEVIINDWLADDLNVKAGDSLSMDYFVIGSLRKLIEKSAKFKVVSIIPNIGSYSDSTLMPDFPGLSEAGSCRNWNTGVPIDLKRIRDKDEEYWNKYRGNPKALIALPDGLQMWENPFGNYTSIRFSRESIHPETLLNTLMHSVRPEQLGMRVLPVYSEGLVSSGNGVDFGQLFLGLSFFIIASGILLIVLIFSLNTASRSTETALLSGLGLAPALILRIRIAESFVIVFFGSLFGALGGIAYNFILIKALNTVWLGAVQTSVLSVHLRFESLATGAGIGFMMAFLSIFMISRKNLNVQVAVLLKGNSRNSSENQNIFPIRNKIISISSLSISLLLSLYSLFSGAYENPALFLTAGALFLLGSVIGVSWFLAIMQGKANYSGSGIGILALKNAGRNKKRSLSVVLLLAIGVYSIILTGSYRKTYHGEENRKESGSGAYEYWAETSLPIPADLNDPKMRLKYLLADTSQYKSTHFEQFHSLAGDDASCLNLNMVVRPRILGIRSEVFAKRGAFSFISLLDKKTKNQPWQQLKNTSATNIIPAFADQSVIQYGLKKSLGDTLQYLNERGEKIYLVLAGGLENSIFQGSLLIDDSLFLYHFPSSGGSSVMLIDAPAIDDLGIAELMNKSFTDYGIEITRASLRLATFNSVENTYLSVFMILGGLGLLIGTLGMAIVLFRNILERKQEFALLSALGFRDKQILSLIMTENFFLFFSGMGCGIVAAFISIIPSLFSPGFNTQILPLILILILLLLSGFIWIYFPSKSAIKGNPATILRND